MEMRCYSKILCFSYKDHVTNEEVRAKRRPVNRRKTAVVWSCLPFNRSGQNNLARHSEKGQKTRQIEEQMERQHQGMDRPGVRQVPEGSGKRENGGNWLRTHMWCSNDPRG